MPVPGKYRRITHLSHIMRLLERILDGRIRKRIEQDLGEEQWGFRTVSGTTDGIFVLRQLVEKGLEMQGRMAVGFVNLEKAYDKYPREMVTAAVRWVGVPESEAVVAMCENKRRVVVVSGLSEEFPVNTGLMQGSSLSPFVFIVVMELISSRITTMFSG